MPPTTRMEPYPTTRPQDVSDQPVSESSSSSTSQPLIKLSKDVIKQTVKAAMKLVTHELFSENAMTIGKASKKAMLTKVIQDAVLRCFGPDVMFEDFILDKHHMHVSNALTTPPIVYRKRVINKITVDVDGLAFMHIYTFDQDGEVIIKAKFQHPFIMSNVIRFIWYGLRHEFLGETEEEKLKNLRFIWALAGAATFCSLDEQADDTVDVDRFRGKACNKKFLAILNAMDNLTDDELAELQRFFHIIQEFIN
ncbi:hypothetical protein DFJ58DRAFT_732559 [Suillus subalutaceus]|uniref:uncharacterized protein n=1 Tax=Suillus subalutaceus TaxID=48586 RepID=UPI001B8726DA|nr:uncharacterized protein DFJ58DRAFT_732559 [Suillus subalutaceus]KAG1841107.1 hypothetical protein DFJ58DRAFT_732559 [Suillus subalutaceus]